MIIITDDSISKTRSKTSKFLSLQEAPRVAKVTELTEATPS